MKKITEETFIRLLIYKFKYANTKIKQKRI